LEGKVLSTMLRRQLTEKLPAFRATRVLGKEGHQALEARHLPHPEGARPDAKNTGLEGGGIELQGLFRQDHPMTRVQAGPGGEIGGKKPRIPFEFGEPMFFLLLGISVQGLKVLKESRHPG
jgi:hypothetical protein